MKPRRLHIEIEDQQTRHRRRHVELHAKLDELVADWCGHTGRRPSAATVLELMQWSNQQTKEPTP